MDKWIMLDPENGNTVEVFNSEAAAVEAANSAIQEYNDGEWCEGVEHILVAKITHQTVKIPMPFPDDVKEQMEEDPDYRPPYDEYCNYEIQPVRNEGTG